MSITIKSRTGATLYVAESARDIQEALREAIADGAYLSGADLRWANLRGANLSEANLSEANLSEADLRGANLSGADLILAVSGLPSGHATLMPTPDGWSLRVGCWTGTVAGLREMIAKDDGWPEATGEQIALRRPMLTALADMCDAWTASKQWALDAITAKWATS